MKLQEVITIPVKVGDMVEILPGSPQKEIRMISGRMVYWVGGGDYPKEDLVFDKKVGKINYWKTY